jgi:dihydrofolate synthase/folylpolyglutamate synthase
MTLDSVLTYDQALAFWFGRINYEQRVPLPSDLKLDRMRALLERVGNPHERLRVLHVAGSKGKGSTSAMLASILRQAGYRTGLFTSPHLCRVEERIQVDGEPITAEELTILLGEVSRAVGWRPGLPSGPLSLSPTFFEVTTALGFLHFVRRRVDVAVLEVGLGGRFDSTNVCRPEVALITSISSDHTQQLGHRLASIAMEKAGIVKPGRPAISGVRGAEARAVIERICRSRQAPLQQIDLDFHYSYEPGMVDAGFLGNNSTSPESGAYCFSHQPRLQVRTRQRTWPVMELGLLGDHQAANAAVALACVEQLRKSGWRISDQAAADGLAKVRWPARLEVLGRRPLVVLDCAHNVASVEALVETLEASFPPARRWLIFASSNDKDVAGMFRVLAPSFSHAFLTRYGNNPRSVSPEELASLLQRCADLPGTVCQTAADAWQSALRLAAPEDLICITGSVFLAGELRPLVLSYKHLH